MNPWLSIYAIVNRLGLLRSPFFQRFFARAYFTYKSRIEDPFTPFVRRHPSLFKGGHILDVGANIGYTAVLFAKTLSPGFRVYAFEPEERNFEMLQQSVHDQDVEKDIVCVRAAIGDRQGQAELWLNPGHHADHRIITSSFQGVTGVRQDRQQVPLLRLDDFCAKEIPGEAIRFIKIDVQGYEECVCRGMGEILDKNPQALIGLEYYPSGIEILGFKPDDVLLFFKERGYGIYVLTRRRGLERTSYDALVHTTVTGYGDLVFSKSDTILDGTPS